MLKYLVLASLIGCAAAVEVQDQIYIVSGILGGVCLLLTIAAIYNAVTIIGLQAKVQLLQSGGERMVKAATTAATNLAAEQSSGANPKSGPSKREAVDVNPQSRDPYSSPSDREDFNRHARGPVDNFNRPPPQDNYRMNSRPAPPPRPQQQSIGYY